MKLSSLLRQLAIGNRQYRQSAIGDWPWAIADCQSEHRRPRNSRFGALPGWLLGLAVWLLPGVLLAKVTVTPGSYRGWPGAFILDNGKAVVVVVPSIGRVMQFGLKGEEGVFWENPKLYGHLADIRLP